jgi:putative peptidoglycan lipid II flippase
VTTSRSEGPGTVQSPASPPSGTSPKRPELSALLVGAGIFLSRVAGFAREWALAFFFGAGPVLDAFRAALRTPNVLQNLLGEGSLSASFIPVYSEFLEQGREREAGRFAGAALGLLSVTAFGLAAVGILLAPLFIPLFFPEFEAWQQQLTVRLVRILFLMTAVLVVSAWALGVLNSHRKFFLSYVAPVLWNLAMIATLAAFGGWMGWGGERLVVALAWGAVAGGALQLGIQLPWVIPVLRHFRLSLGRKVAGVEEAIRNLGPVVAARGVINLSGWLDMILAGLLVDGALSILGFVQTLYMLPIALFGMAIAASELPELSRGRQAVGEVLVPRVRSALDRMAFLLIPSALAYLVLGDLFFAALFQYGAFEPAATVVSYAVLGAYALGLAASASSRALSSAYFALRDTRTPAKIAYGRVAVSAVLGVALMFPLDRWSVGTGEGTFHFGAVGLGLGAAAGAWLEYALLRRKLGAKIGPHGPARSRVMRMLAAGSAAAAVGAGGKWVLGSVVPAHQGLLAAVVSPEAWFYAPLLAAGTGLLFGVVYLGVTAALGVGVPLRTLARSLRR